MESDDLVNWHICGVLAERMYHTEARLNTCLEFYSPISCGAALRLTCGSLQVKVFTLNETGMSYVWFELHGK